MVVSLLTIIEAAVSVIAFGVSSFDKEDAVSFLQEIDPIIKKPNK